MKIEFNLNEAYSLSKVLKAGVVLCENIEAQRSSRNVSLQDIETARLAIESIENKLKEVNKK
jgi:hypothetical protein